MTAHQLLETLHVRGVQLSRVGGRLMIDAPAGSLTATDRQSLEAHKVELMGVMGFAPDLAELVLWFRYARALGRLPDEPFALAPWQQVVDPATFYAALELDIAIGPEGARARFGGLMGSLRRLRAFVEARGHEECPLPGSTRPQGF
ncbi:MAG TPA: hypothetical protein VH643_15420 [Gemmataceae bacterium]|jgi:hypothetical protein